MSTYLNKLSKPALPIKTRKSRFWLHILILLVIGTYLRVWSMMNESPAFEETIAALTAKIPVNEYISQTQPDFCPPVFYAVSHLVAIFTESLDALRIISIIAGALSPLALYLIGRRLYGETVAILSAYLLLLNPLQIYYSQEFQPSALFALIGIVAYLAMVRSAESNRWRDWLVYDILAIILLHTQREAAFFVLAFPLIQLCRAIFFPPVNEERRIHRFKLIQGIILNHFIIIAISIPWLMIMPNKLPWDLDKPVLSDITSIFGQYYLVGLTNWRPMAPSLATLLLFILMLPPLAKTIRRIDFRTFAAVAMIVFVLGLPFTYSLFETPRFLPEREGFSALPWFCLTIGILLARCNWVIKSGLTLFFTITFVSATVHQARTLQKTATTDMLNAIINDKATPDSLVAFWPGSTTQLGTFWKDFYNQPFKTTSAGDLLTTWAEIPTDNPIYFVISQFKGNSAHLHTFQGALTQYSNSEVLWQNRLNMVIKASNLDQKSLERWYKEPRSLKILDQPTSSTQFIFTAADEIFKPKNSIQEANWPFAWDRTDLSYEPTGQRFIWTTKPTATMELKVTLAPGKYILRLHCSPEFDQWEYGRYKDRSVQLELRAGEDRRKVQLDHADTVNLAFSTDVELDRLRVNITVDKMHEVPPPSPGSYGLKIYSISIDQDTPTSGNFSGN